MGDFFNIGGVDKNLVSSTAIEIFLKEKNMLELVFKLRKEVPEGQKKRYDKNDLKRVLFSTSNETKSEKITITDSEIVIDGHENVNEESEKPDLEELAGKYANEMEKTDVDSFLSPEEEETLLSLYDDEIKELSEETRNQFPESDIGTVKTSIDDLNKIISEQEEEETESLNLEELSLTDSEVSKSLSEEIPKLGKTEFSEQIEIESESSNHGIEKEIVEEMIRDFVGEEKSSESSEKSSTGNLEVNTFQSTADLPELNTLENELLSIFEELDKDNVGIPSDEIMIEEIKEVQDDEKNEAKDLFAPFLEEDGIDDYLKSIDEIVSPERNEKAVVDEIEENINEEIPEPPIPIQIEEKVLIEKNIPAEKPKFSRVVRQKDLFSYLKRKELKKIVTLIFANDEEDFTNTLERLMDCHSYKEASEILKAVFTSYKISPYSKEAITFTNAVSNYFRQA
jgi:hypothetical protein